MKWSNLDSINRRLLAARLWSLCNTSGGRNQCWPWTGPTNKGYGMLYTEGAHHGAHRISYIIATGEDIGDDFIRHSCDNPPCCNPSHLLRGDHIANMKDMADRDRAGGKILSDEMALEILARFRKGETQSALGRSFGVHRSTVYDVVHRRYKWANERFG